MNKCDATRLAELLMAFSHERGVQHITGDVVDLTKTNQGELASITLSDHTIISADLFIDASGFSALLIDKALDVPFNDFSQQLLNDSAVAVSTKPLRTTQQTYTQSKALSAGWMWQIPLQSRTGNGYVYSSKHISKEQAEHELATELKLTHADLTFRHIKMNVGMRNTPWMGNVVAIGLSHSFIEPLEATALMVTQRSIELFIALVENNQKTTQQKRESYNGQMSQLLLGIKDYIVAHYCTSQRRDSAYWREAAKVAHKSKCLTQLTTTWLAGNDFDAVLHQHETTLAYFRPSWYILFAGMDFRDGKLCIKHDGVSRELVAQARQRSHYLANHFYNKNK